MNLKREVLPPRERPTIAEIELVEIARRQRSRDKRIFVMLVFGIGYAVMTGEILRWVLGQ